RRRQRAVLRRKPDDIPVRARFRKDPRAETEWLVLAIRDGIHADPRRRDGHARQPLRPGDVRVPAAAALRARPVRDGHGSGRAPWRRRVAYGDRYWPNVPDLAALWS